MVAGAALLPVIAKVGVISAFALGVWSFVSSSLERSEIEKVAVSGGRGGGGGHMPDEGDRLPRDPKPYPHPREADQQVVLRIIKFMTYNVWFRKDMAVHQRMKAIGCLIQQHSPDVILFQEVKPNIYQIFQSSNWWKAYEYKCSALPDETTGRCFCLLLSKLPIREFFCKRLKRSRGREVSVAEIDVGMDKKLVAATSHLKSPSFREMHSKKRVAQAKEVVSLLNSEPNVIFGGDMNWNEDSDGLLPLPDGWVDAWTNLRPAENGWTFDTKSNQMLQRKHPLQKRLDRFLCKLKDFRLISVEMIGMEPIPGLSHRNEDGKVLPVLPSDHYGLLLTICTLNHARKSNGKVKGSV